MPICYCLAIYLWVFIQHCNGYQIKYVYSVNTYLNVKIHGKVENVFTEMEMS